MTVQNLKKAKVFSTVDLESGFLQIQRKKSDRAKTAFGINVYILYRLVHLLMSIWAMFYNNFFFFTQRTCQTRFNCNKCM